MWFLARNEYLSNEATIAMYNNVLQLTLLYASENWVCPEKLNKVGVGHLTSVCDKIRSDKVRTD